MTDDRYQREQQIGHGGTGAVWRGRDTVLGRSVVIKQLGLSHGETEPDAARAEREAHLAARVHHPNIVAVYDLVDDGDHQWLVMEHIDGATLAQLCDGRPLPAGRAAHLLAQVADALAASHAHGIVHRDVKPSNVLVGHDDVAKLSDFGIARHDTDEALTRTGLITGSPAYLSPEVARGQTATAASDVWSLGATVYHACTGTPPYAVGSNAITAVEHILDDTAPSLAASHPLADVVARTMQRDPADRPTMDDVAAQLHALAPGAESRTVNLEDIFDNDAPATDAHPTQQLTAAAAWTDHPPARRSSQPTASRAARRAAPRRRAPWLVGAAAAAVALGIGAAVAFSGDDSAVSAASPTAQTRDSGTLQVTAETLEEFATDYLDAAGNDPSQGFSMLTPSYQQASGGLDGYQGFWGDVSNIEVRRVFPDVDQMRVTYIYSYERHGRSRTETVTLHLEQDGDRLLVAGADSI